MASPKYKSTGFVKLVNIISKIKAHLMSKLQLIRRSWKTHWNWGDRNAYALL